MAYAGDLKSPDAHASCGFDPHPGHHMTLNGRVAGFAELQFCYPPFAGKKQCLRDVPKIRLSRSESCLQPGRVSNASRSFRDVQDALCDTAAVKQDDRHVDRPFSLNILKGRFCIPRSAATHKWHHECGAMSLHRSWTAVVCCKLVARTQALGQLVQMFRVT